MKELKLTSELHSLIVQQSIIQDKIDNLIKEQEEKPDFWVLLDMEFDRVKNEMKWDINHGNFYCSNNLLELQFKFERFKTKLMYSIPDNPYFYYPKFFAQRSRYEYQDWLSNPFRKRLI